MPQSDVDVEGAAHPAQAGARRFGFAHGIKVIFSIRENRIELEVPSNSILDWHGATAGGETQDYEAVTQQVRANIAKEVVREGTGD